MDQESLLELVPHVAPLSGPKLSLISSKPTYVCLCKEGNQIASLFSQMLLNTQGKPLAF